MSTTTGNLKSLLYSFVAGVGSILSICPTLRAATKHMDTVEAIGADFARVGADLQAAMDAKGDLLSLTPRPESAPLKEEQLELIESA